MSLKNFSIDVESSLFLKGSILIFKFYLEKNNNIENIVESFHQCEEDKTNNSIFDG